MSMVRRAPEAFMDQGHQVSNWKYGNTHVKPGRAKRIVRSAQMSSATLNDAPKVKNLDSDQ